MTTEDTMDNDALFQKAKKMPRVFVPWALGQLTGMNNAENAHFITMEDTWLINPTYDNIREMERRNEAIGSKHIQLIDWLNERVKPEYRHLVTGWHAYGEGTVTRHEVFKEFVEVIQNQGRPVRP